MPAIDRTLHTRICALNNSHTSPKIGLKQQCVAFGKNRTEDHIQAPSILESRSAPAPLLLRTGSSIGPPITVILECMYTRLSTVMSI